MIPLKGVVFSLLAMMIIIGCQTDIDEMTVDTVIPTPDVIVRADLRGIITDQNNQPIQGAEVKAGNDILFTDQWGYFSFQLAGLDAQGALVTVKKNGYFNGSRFIKPSLKDNYIQIKLIAEANVGSFNAANGATIDLNDGAQIIFAADIFQLANGDPFNGTVNVSAYWLDPTLPELGELMPTNLVGKNLADENVTLASLGMMVVELSTNSGQTIKIKEESEAELLFPIPIEMQATAPSFIPLWSFTEAQKIWIQEGQAALDGNYYRAKVKHFSWWNCDWPYPAIDLKGKLVYEDEVSSRMAAPNIKLRISIIDRPWFSTVVYSNVEGVFNSVIPSSSLVRLEILDECDQIVLDQEIGPYSADFDLGEIVIGSLDNRMVSISGMLIDCDSNLLQNGYAIIKYGGNFSIVEVGNNGEINTNLPLCEGINDINVVGYNRSGLIQSFNTLFVLEDNSINFGTLMVCQTIEEYISITMNGITYYNYGPFEQQSNSNQDTITYGYFTTLNFYSDIEENDVWGDIGLYSNGTGSGVANLSLVATDFDFRDESVARFEDQYSICNGAIFEFDTIPNSLVHIEFLGQFRDISGNFSWINGVCVVKNTF